MASIPQFHFRRWIRSRHAVARISLAAGSVPPPPEEIFPLHRVGWRLDQDLEEAHDRLLDRVARHLGLESDRVAVLGGATYSLQLALRALMPDFAHALVETPASELLWRLPDACGLPYRRLAASNDPQGRGTAEGLARALEDGPALVILGNPHDPTGRLLEDSAVAELAALAEAYGAMVLVDEAHLEFHPETARPYRTLAAVSERFVVSGSLARIAGLTSLRFAWVAGPRQVIARVRKLDELAVGQLPALVSQAVWLALERAPALLARGRAYYTDNWPRLAAWAAGFPGVEVLNPGAGILVALRISEEIDTLALSENLLTRDGVLVAPAEMFGGKGFLRLGLAVPTAQLEEGLAALGRALTLAVGARS